MKVKDVDIIIVTYNRSEFLAQTLNKLQYQTITNFNLIVTDDGSKTNHLIDPNKFPIISKYLWAKDEGFTKVDRLNEAMSMCSSPYTIILDDDCVPQSQGFIQTHLQSLEKFPISRGIIQFPSDNYADANAWFSCANIGFQTKILKEIGYYDQRYNGHYGHEDQDMGLTLRKFGYTRSAPQHIGTLTYHLGKNYADNDRSWNVIGHNTDLFIQKWGFDPRQPKPWVDQ
jgi:glycosyltransferase involved in cell wall biosynthesis